MKDPIATINHHLESKTLEILSPRTLLTRPEQEEL